MSMKVHILFSYISNMKVIITWKEVLLGNRLAAFWCGMLET